jgi:GWxTD domain-containing protein
MKSQKLFITLFFFLLFLGKTYSADNFYFDADYSVFRSSQTKSIVEVYFSFAQNGLLHIKSGNDFVGTANTQIIIKEQKTSTEVFNEIYGLQSVVKDTSKSKLLSRLIGQQNLTIPVGVYEITFIGFDQNNLERKDTIKLALDLNQFEDNKSSLSSLQISSNIDKSSDKSSIFYKNGLEITPNPNVLFGSNLNKLYYYIEIYFPSVDFNSDSSGFVVDVTDMSGTVLLEKKKKVNLKNDVYAETGVFMLDSLSTGSYLINAVIFDNTKSKKILREKKFYIFNSVKKEDYTASFDKDFLQSEFVVLREDQVDEEFSKIIYLRSTPENKEWDNLKTLDEKRKYLFRFWKKRDSNLLTPRIETRDEYFKRIKEANKVYKQSFTDGWKSDRGRIYVLYGVPNDVEKHFMEADVRNYEIWKYDYVEGGKMCVFGETSASGEGTYFLVHSTLRNEFSDPNWLAKLKK